jgi:hypothetical protein
MDNLSNIDRFIDENIGKPMFEKTSGDFTDKMIREIELAKEFQREDKRTFRFVNFAIAGFAALILTVGAVIIWISSKNIDEQGIDTEGTGFAISQFIGNLNTKIFGIFGVSLTPEAILYFIGILVFVFIFSVADKFLFRRSY